MKIVVTAGGGGHFAAAIAVIEFLPKGTEVLVVGRKYALEGDKALSLEYMTCQKKSIPFVSLQTGRLQRKLTKHTIPSLLKIPFGFFKAQKILRDFKPDVVLSFGGYVAVPICVAAWFLHIPVVVHEQTLEAGMANKITSYFAKKVCISWESSVKFFPKKKVVLTGNPIRRLKINDSRLKILNKENLPIVYITGGSSGSHAINLLVEECIKKLLEKCIVIHQTGSAKEFNDFERLKILKAGFNKSLQDRYILTEFASLDDVGLILSKADLVVSRSGINTVTELLFFGRPAILIPLPFAQRNEQLKNALFLQKIGLAKVFAQEGLTSDKLYNVVLEMLSKKNEYIKYKENVWNHTIDKAPQEIIAVLQSVIKK